MRQQTQRRFPRQATAYPCCALSRRRMRMARPTSFQTRMSSRNGKSVINAQLTFENSRCSIANRIVQSAHFREGVLTNSHANRVFSNRTPRLGKSVRIADSCDLRLTLTQGAACMARGQSTKASERGPNPYPQRVRVRATGPCFDPGLSPVPPGIRVSPVTAPVDFTGRVTARWSGAPGAYPGHATQPAPCRAADRQAPTNRIPATPSGTTGMRHSPPDS